MAYSPQTWTDSPATTTPISAARLGVMEAGIAAASRPTTTLTTPAATSGTTQTQIASLPIPANTLTAGATYRINAFGAGNTASATMVFQIHLGPANTTADPVITSVSQAVSVQGVMFDGLLTVRSTGTSGTCIANAATVIINGAGASITTATTAVNTTVQNYLTLSASSSVGLLTIHNAILAQLA